jgi:hypothetical protein
MQMKITGLGRFRDAAQAIVTVLRHTSGRKLFMMYDSFSTCISDIRTGVLSCATRQTAGSEGSMHTVTVHCVMFNDRTCRHAKSTKAALAAEVATRFATVFLMCESLKRHRATCTLCVHDPEFGRLAAASKRNGTYLDTEGLGQDDMEHLDMEEDLVLEYPSGHMPEAVRTNKVYACAFAAVCSSKFWSQLSEYMSLTQPFAAGITALSADSASLSDAARLFIELNSKVLSFQAADFPTLLTASDVTEIQNMWAVRFNNHLRPHHYVALLLDPRRHMRAFVQNQPAVVGSKADGSWGNTPIIKTAVQFVRDYSETLIDKSVEGVSALVAKVVAVQNMPKVSAQKRLLEAGLRAFIGTHPQKTRSDMGINEEQLKEVVESDTPTTFWLVQVDTDCVVRRLALRVLCGKPSSIAVERLWNAFGDNLTKKRRSVLNENLCQVVYVKMNAHLVPNSMLNDLSPKLVDFVQHQHTGVLDDIVSFAEEADVEKDVELALARQLAGPGQPINEDPSIDQELDAIVDSDDGMW